MDSPSDGLKEVTTRIYSKETTRNNRYNRLKFEMGTVNRWKESK